MTIEHMILDKSGPTPVMVKATLDEWAKWLNDGEGRIVGKDDLSSDVRVSTVCLGLDHSFGEGEPLWFETMVFGGPLDQEQDRYSTWDEAVKGHEAMVAKAKEAATKEQDNGSRT